MAKHIIIREREVRQDILKIINESELPAFMVRTILKDYYEQLEPIEQQQYKEALQQYEQEQQAKEEKKKKEVKDEQN